VIPLARPDLGPTELSAVTEVLSSGSLVQGPVVARFESVVADYLGVAQAVAVTNCTAALHLSLLSVGIGPGDVVVVPTYSWLSTANVVELVGATPRFVDIDPTSMNLSAAALADALGNGPPPAAVVFVHTFGNTAGVGEVLRIVRAAGVPLLEDAACAYGALTPAGPAGTLGFAGCFSFHPRKALTTGEGGMVVTGDADLARQVRILRNHGLDPDAPAPDFVAAGFNCRMTEFQAALGLVQHERLGELLAQRRRVAAVYDGLLKDTDVQTPVETGPDSHVYQSYVVQLPARCGGRVAEVVAGLRSRGIETTIGTWHMPLTRHFRQRYGFTRGDFPATDEVFDRALSLPMPPDLSTSDQERVVAELLAVIEEVSR
jgi:perosamine synthetase